MAYVSTRLIEGAKLMKKFRGKLLVASLLGIALFLSSCTTFNGVRKPLYNGEPVAPNEEAIEVYQTSREIVGVEKEFYLRYPFSEAIQESSLDYTNEDPVLLEEGTYIIGEDIPAGRVSLIGNESVFTSENNAVHVGNLMIRDAADAVYFENLFHTDYGQLVSQVDFIEGHTIEVIGDDPQITAFYTATLPDDPYILMDPPELLMNLERLDFQQPVVTVGASVTLTAGIYEVGEHLEAGQYNVVTVQAPHNTELIRFRAGEEPAVYELRQTFEMEEESSKEISVDYPTIELQDGDKIYPSLVRTLQLVKVTE